MGVFCVYIFMQYIYNVSQLPYGEVPEGSIYYNRITREIVSSSRNGTKKFKAIKTPYPVNAFSINGYYPLYATAALAESKSPLGTISQFDFAQLGEAPLGINYPVFMPKGLDESYLGNYINPLGDHDDDETINFRDPQLVGIESLPLLNYRRIDPFQKPDGTYFSVKNYIARPDRGTYNNTDNPVAVATKYSGIVIDSDNNVTWVQGPGGCIIPPGGIFFKNINFLTLPLDSAGYNGTDPYSIADGTAPTEIYSDAYTSPGGQEVDIGAYLDNGHSGYVNSSASDLFVETINAGIIVGSNGVVSYFMPGRIKVAPGSAWFIDVKNIHSPFNSIDTPYNGTDPFTPFPGCSINMHDYIEYTPYLEHLSGHEKNPIDEGYINNTGATVQVQVPGKALVISPSCTISPYDAGELSLPNGHALICESSLGLLRAIQKNTLEVDLPPEPDISSIQGIQWWRETSDGNLELLPDYITTYEPAVSYWEDVDEFSMTPREAPYVRYDESFQYFELDGSLNVRPFGEVVLPTFNLQLSSDPANTASLSGDGSYEYGSYISISCEPFPGYSFINWTGGGSNVFDENNKNTIVQVNENISLTANMEPAKLSLIIDRYTNGSKSGAGGTTTGSANDITYGTSQAITATAAIGHNFTNWQTDDKSYTSVINISLTADTTSSGYVVQNLHNGESGEDISILIEPGDTLVFTNNTGGHPLAIEDSSNTLIASESSTVTTYQFNTAGTYNYYCTAHPTTMRGTINVQPSIADINSNSTTVRMTEDRVINANFDLIEYNITVNADNYLYNGSSEVAGTATIITAAPYKHFDFVSISASPIEISKYEFSFWTSESQSTNNYTIDIDLNDISINGSTNESLSLQAGDIQIFDWSNTVDQDYPDGRPLKFSTTVGGSNNSGSQYFKSVHIDTVNYTTTITTHADTPTLYYYIDGLGSTGGAVSTIAPSIPGIDSIYNSNATINSLSSDLNLRAVFKLKEYNVVTELVGGQGSIQGLTEDTGSTPTTFSGSFPFGSTIQLAANADIVNGYEFNEWGGYVTSSNPNLSLVVNEDINLTIEFTLKSYTLIVSIDNDSRDDETNTNSPKWSDEGGANVWTVTPTSSIQVANPSTYTFTFQHGDNIVLEPKLKSNYAVMSWNGTGITQVGDNLDFTITSNISATLTVGAYPELNIAYDKLHAHFGDTFDILDGSHGGAYTDTDHDDHMASSIFSLDAFNQSKGTLGNSSNTYVNFHEDSYIELISGAYTELGNHNGEWAVCFTLGAIPRVSSPWIFARGGFALMHEGPPTADGYSMQQAPIPYFQGKRIGGNNAGAHPESGSTLIYVFSGGHFTYYLDGVKKINNAAHSTSWGGDIITSIDFSAPFIIGPSSSSTWLTDYGFPQSLGGGFNGIMRNVVLLDGDSVSQIGDDIADYHTHREDPTQLSWYGDVLDWLPLGNDTYPDIEGAKGAIFSKLVGGDTNDFITNPECITLNPAVDGGATTDTIEIGLEVTDQQGLSISQKRTIEFGLQSYLVNISIEEFNYKGTLETPGSSNHNASTTQFNDVHIYATVDSIYSDKYEFSHWDGPDASLLDDSTRVDTFIPSISQDINITAVYKLKQYTLTLDKSVNSTTANTISNFNTNVSMTGSGTYDYGTAVEIGYEIDSNNQHFTFSNWDPTANVADSTVSPTNTIEIVDDLTVTGVFDVKTYTATVVLSDASNDTGNHIFLDFTGIATLSVPGGSDSTSPTINFPEYNINQSTTYNVITITTEALESKAISCQFPTGSEYGFMQWAEPNGNTYIEDNLDSSTNLNINQDGILVVAVVGKLPISDFLINSLEEDGNFYFGSSLELIELAKAPTNDGRLTESNFSGATFTSHDTGVRLFANTYQSPELNWIEIANPGIYGDFKEPWSILLDFDHPDGGAASILSRDAFSMGFADTETGSNWGSYFYNGSSGITQTNNFNSSFYRRMVLYCNGTSIYAAWNQVPSHSSSIKNVGGGNTSSLTSPTGALTLFGVDPNNSSFIANASLGTKGHSIGAYVRDIAFLPSSITTEQRDEFLEISSIPFSDLSFYNDLDDHIICGSDTYPDLIGEKGAITAELKNGISSQFKTTAKLTLPEGSPGDTASSIDITLEVTDDQNLVDSVTKTINYGPKPIDTGEVTYSQFITTTDGLNLLANTSVLGVSIETSDGTSTTNEDYL